MADDLTPFDVVLAACDTAYEIQHGEPHPSTLPPSVGERAGSIWDALNLPDLRSWSALFAWFTGQKS